MRQFDLYSLREVFADQGVMICFNGPFSHSVIEELGIAVRKYLESDDAPKDRVADVFAVFVEQAQNLKNYTSSVDEGDSIDPRFHNGTLVIAREGDRYIVSSGNLLRAEDRGHLDASLSSIKSLDGQGLRALYKQRLRGPAGPGGAGLGLIDMARRASEPIVYSFRDQPSGEGTDSSLPPGTTFFNISVII